jgi:integrase
MDIEASQSLVLKAEVSNQSERLALLNAISFWADSCTQQDAGCRDDLLRDKQRAVDAFFAFTKKHPGEITPQDVKEWQAELERKDRRQNTIYVRVSFLSSFYGWLVRDLELGQYISKNPVSQARPRSPKAYQTESVKSLTDEELDKLLSVVAARAAAGDVVGKQDYALLLMFVATGMRRAEILGLRGRDLRLDEGLL